MNRQDMSIYYTEIAKLQLEIGRRPEASNICKHQLLEHLSFKLIEALYDRDRNCSACNLPHIGCICDKVTKFFS